MNEADGSWYKLHLTAISRRRRWIVPLTSWSVFCWFWCDRRCKWRSHDCDVSTRRRRFGSVLTLNWTRQVGTDIRLTESEPVTMSTRQSNSFSWGRETTHIHTHTLEPNTHTHSWGPWRWNLNVGLTLVTDSFCPPCWTETHQKETRDVMTVCSDIIVTRPIGRTINVLCYTCKLWIFPLERTLSSVIN